MNKLEDNYDSLPECQDSSDFDETTFCEESTNSCPSDCNQPSTPIIGPKFSNYTLYNPQDKEFFHLLNTSKTVNKDNDENNNPLFSTASLSITDKGLIKSQRKKLAIVGSASSSLHLAPYDDYTYDIMGLGWRQDLRRVDILIDIHRIDNSRLHVPPNYNEYLKSKNIPVYVQEHVTNIPNSVRFPIEMAVEKFGDYYASSVSYAIALAIMSGYKEIFLVGIDMLADSEYSYQKPNAEYLLGFARGMGINVRIPFSSALLKFDHRYGYDKEPNNNEVLELLDSSIKGYNESYEEHKNQAVASDGARQAMQKLRSLVLNKKRGMINV